MSQMAEPFAFDAEISARQLDRFTAAVTAIAEMNYGRQAIPIEVSDDGIRCQLVDVSNVAFVEATIPRESFQTFELDAPVTIPMESSVMETIPVSDDAGMVRLRYDPDEHWLELDSNRLTLSYDCPESTNSHETDAPSVDQPFAFEAQSGRLSAVVAGFSHSDYKLRVANGDDGFAFEQVPIEDDGDHHHASVVRGELELPSVDRIVEDGPAESLYSLDYVQPVFDSISDGVTCRIQSGVDLPITIQYPVDKPESAGVEFLIAPRTGGVE